MTATRTTQAGRDQTDQEHDPEGQQTLGDRGAEPEDPPNEETPPEASPAEPVWIRSGAVTPSDA